MDHCCCKQPAFLWGALSEVVHHNRRKNKSTHILPALLQSIYCQRVRNGWQPSPGSKRSVSLPGQHSAVTHSKCPAMLLQVLTAWGILLKCPAASWRAARRGNNWKSTFSFISRMLNGWGNCFRRHKNLIVNAKDTMRREKGEQWPLLLLI